jgi:tryptophanyl-tRNA synthetase
LSNTFLLECRYALSGGQKTEQEQREKGADLSKDVSYKWLEFFLEDDAQFKQIGQDYAAGRMLTGEIKQVLIGVLQELVGRHQKARALVTDNVVRAFMAQRVMTDLWG